MSDFEQLKPCPFCGAGETLIVPGPSTWAGMRSSEPSTYSVRHWCDPIKGQPSRMLERIGRDKQSAIDAWNTRAAIASMQGEAKKLHMVEPDHRLIGCANCGSHDVGAGHTIAHCYGCKDKVQGESVDDTIEKWNNKQLATLATHAADSAARIAEQDARIKELEQQLEEARKDIKEARIALQTAVYTPNLTMQDMNFLTKHAFNSLEKYKDIDAAILQIGGAE